ncbi:MAG TPA: DUF4263 domain-containing protein [Syntrophales bacterium]|nr:DUF4263 domain-containing protein [Syntrophales bacterium]HPQ43312.1 DUF4263 domain-containing protein [Syntrophales bacterium]
MSRKRKKGFLRIEGTNPMTFVEANDDTTIAAWTPEQESLANAVSKAVKSYIETTEALASGKYEHLRDMIPEYLRNPGNLLIAVCSDGIVIRYEKKGSEKHKRAVAVIPKSIIDVSALLSQNLIHIESPETPQPLNENFGVDLKLSVHSSSQGTSRDIVSTRIWFQVKNVSLQETMQPSAKPYCLLSVRNQLELELHGVLIPEGTDNAPEKPFVARTTLRLFAGWECIEVFPGLELDNWNPEFAPLWAERDMLGAALVSQTRDVHLSNLDPRSSARRQYASLLYRFKNLLDSNPEHEQSLQSFLQDNPILLCPSHVRMWPKLPLEATITDFVFCDASREYILVELERSTLTLFRKDGHATADLTHAQGQILDWKRYIEDNLSTVQRELGLVDITPNPNGLIVIGRSKSLLPRDRRKIKTMASESPKLRIMTYDDVYANAKAVFENLLGPIWDTGGATQIYYPMTL